MFDQFIGVKPVEERHRIDVGRLAQYLRGKIDDWQGELKVEQFKGGQSNPTYRVTAGGRRYVLRRKPPGKLLPSAHAVEREYKVIKALHGTGFPVARPYALCEDDTVVGTAFYVMDCVEGRVLWDQALPGMQKAERAAIWDELNRVIAQLHGIDYKAVGLEDFGKPGDYIARQVSRWTRQYQASELEKIEEMDRLIEWLPQNIPAGDETSVVHGDYRLDNAIFHPTEPRILAVLDWELSTLGHPLADFAYHCMSWHIAPGKFRGIAGLDLAALGIPSERDYVERYCKRTGRRGIDPSTWDYYMAYNLFRIAGITQGIAKRVVDGTAASEYAREAGSRTRPLAELAWAQVEKNLKRAQPRRRNMDFEYSQRVQEMRKRLIAFMDEHIYPNEPAYYAHTHSDKRWTPVPIIEELKPKARKAGLWNLFLPHSKRAPEGLSNLEYAPLCEIMGRTSWSPEVFNCSAPDTGNMETIERYGSEEQKKEWLEPLLRGEIRSAFLMTEPAVASSDATNIQMQIKRDGNDYVINGRKWWSSGAGDPRCKIYIVMGKTNPDHASRHSQQSMILVPAGTKGVMILHHLNVFGYDDAPHGHMEIEFKDVRVPAANILLGEGRGFEIAQGRLGPGRIHHCMRLIGQAERALEKMCKRATQRVAFGRTIAEQGVTRERIAEARIMIDSARFMVLHAAWKMDTVGNKVAQKEIAMIKVLAPTMACQVIDWAMQVHGGGGVTDQFGLANMYAHARTLRFADGPDEVHRNAIAKLEIAEQTSVAEALAGRKR